MNIKIQKFYVGMFGSDTSDGFYLKTISQRSFTTLAWLLHNARNCAEGRAYSKEKLDDLLPYLEFTDTFLCLPDDYINLTKPLTKEVDIECVELLSLVACEVVKYRMIKLAPNHYVIETIIGWVKKPKKDQFVAMLIDDMLRINFSWS